MTPTPEQIEAERPYAIMIVGRSIPEISTALALTRLEGEAKGRAQMEAEIERLRAERDKLLSNAKQDANLLRRYHAWCELNSCAPSTSDLYSLVLKEPMP